MGDLKTILITGDLKTIQNKPDRTSRRVVLEQLEVFPLCYFFVLKYVGRLLRYENNKVSFIK